MNEGYFSEAKWRSDQKHAVRHPVPTAESETKQFLASWWCLYFFSSCHEKPGSFTSKLCSLASYHLCNISQIRQFFYCEGNRVASACIISYQLDMSNALLYGLPRTQKIQNLAACPALGAGVRGPYDPSFERIALASNSPTNQIQSPLCRQGPSCIVDMLQLYRPSRSLWSASNELLVVSRCRTMLGNRAFSTFASTLWNSLPTSMRSSETNEF